MTALNVYVNGQEQVSADNLNTFMQTCNTVSDLRSFVGTLDMYVFMAGYVAVGDGGQGNFYWNPNSTAPDDNGVTTIVPYSSTGGAWNRVDSGSAVHYSIIAPLTGFAVTIANSVTQLIINPAGTLAVGAVTMPSLPSDGLVIKISTEQIITSFTVSANTGQTLLGSPTTLAQYTSVSFLYNLAQLKWYRI